VIHENGYVSAQARERVFAAIRESGYRLNVVAQGLRRQRTLTLGHMLHGIGLSNGNRHRARQGAAARASQNRNGPFLPNVSQRHERTDGDWYQR
jgi:DNA-binding LacI/PurR family transcriptional regulator